MRLDKTVRSVRNGSKAAIRPRRPDNALYDGEDQQDLTDGISEPEDLLPELRQTRDALVKLFTGKGIVRGAQLQPYVDACVSALKDQKFRSEFLVLVKRFLGLFETLMPRPEARAFAADVKLYVFVAKAASNLYRDRQLDVRGLAHKVQAMLDAYIAAHGVDPKIPPIEILDANFAAEVARKPSSRARAADMENALRHHISISFEKDPAKYKSLSVRLEAILTSHHQDWDDLARQLQKLIDEATSSSADPSADYGLKPGSEGPIFGLLRMRKGEPGHEEELAEIAVQIADRLRQLAAVHGFWDNTIGLEDARRWIVQLLDSSNLFPFEQLDALAAECVGVARANRSAFAS